MLEKEQTTEKQKFTIEQIKKLREFAKSIIDHIKEDYGGFLGEEKLNMISEQTLIPEDYYKLFTGPQNLQGEIIRLVFRKVFEHIECSKNIGFSDGTTKTIPYGNLLKESLVSYYSYELAKKYNINIDEPNAQHIELINKIKEKLGQNFESLIFNCDANAILSATNDNNITKMCDNDAVKKYIETLNNAKQKETKDDKTITESVKGKGKVYPPIYSNGSQYIKYVDEDNEIHMIKSTNPKVVSSAYKDMVMNLQPGEEIDTEKFFQTLKKHGENIPLFKESEINPSRLTSSEATMLDTLYGDKDIMFKSQGTSTLHSNDMNVHIVNDDVVLTHQDVLGRTTMSDFTENKTTSPSLNADDVKTPRLISEEEYEKLCMKAVNGKPFTSQELREMEYFDLYYYGKSDVKSNLPESVKKEDAKRRLGQHKANINTTNTSGFAQKYLPAFVVLITILLGIVVGIVLYYLKEL